MPNAVPSIRFRNESQGEYEGDPAMAAWRNGTFHESALECDHCFLTQTLFREERVSVLSWTMRARRDEP